MTPITKQSLEQQITYLTQAKIAPDTIAAVQGMRNIPTESAIIALCLVPLAVRRACGLYVHFEWTINPSTQEHDELIRVYIGTKATGPLAVFCSSTRDTAGWQLVQSTGNYGKNPASGGTWRLLERCKETRYVPHVVAKLIRGLPDN